MPGRASMTNVAAVKSDMSTVQGGENPGGACDLKGEFSAIGGEARKGADSYGALSDPSWTRIDSEAGVASGLATKGSMGNGYGLGKTFAGGAGHRSQD